MVGEWMARKAAAMAHIPEDGFEFTWMLVYTSYDPLAGKKSHYHWVENFLNRVPKITAHCLERRHRWAPRCHSCHNEVSRCPTCGASMAGTEEKGVDILLATDMLDLARTDAYAIAVLVTKDSDLTPCVGRLQSIPKQVVQARFAPQGAALAQACNYSLDITPMKEEILRT